MSRIYYFINEAGNFDFSRKNGASRYFVLTTVTMTDCRDADALIPLHRELAWEGLEIKGHFHATTEKQNVRDRVFELVSNLDIQVYASIFDKRKTVEHRREPGRFYKLTWFHHAKNTIPIIATRSQDLHIVAATLATKGDQKRIARGIEDVVKQCGREDSSTRVSHWKCETDPCLQVADYCCWAIQRKWEGGDPRSYDLIKHLIKREKDQWSWGSEKY